MCKQLPSYNGTPLEKVQGEGGTPLEKVRGGGGEGSQPAAVGVALSSCSLVPSLAPCACLWWPLWSWQRLDGKAREPPRSG